ncbi:MAG: beta-lactamase family protein [Pseudomonadales bacterium]|nr:beta-lactamase family protein [Pseudomonadales bacterium]
MEVEIHGDVAPGFEPVRQVFADLWKEIEIGASVCVYHQGKKVVDLWGGYTDVGMSHPWQRDTLVNVYSTTKGLASAAVAALYDEGKLDYDAKVIEYWPEFGAEGKQDVTVAQLLSHQAGLCGVDTKLTVEDLYDWDKMVNLLAAQKPLWSLGKDAGYHAVTWGYLPGELVRRITGKTLGQYFREKIAGPLDADCYIGLPDSEMARVATLNGPNRARKKPKAPANTNMEMPKLYPIALLNPSISPFKDACSREWRKAEIAAANAQANARGIATIYAALSMNGELNGVRILSKDAIDAATKLEVDNEIDLVTGRAMRRGRGFMLNTEGAYGPSPNAFGHAGAGGSVGFADRDNQVAIGYAMNQMQADLDASPRSVLLGRAVYECIG